MTPLHAWLRGLSSDSWGVFRVAWLTDAANPERMPQMGGTISLAQVQEFWRRQGIGDGMTADIRQQRIGEVVGRWGES